MSDRDDYVYSGRVCYEIAAHDHEAYESAAKFINRRGYDVLSVQHEYGIFGGEAGAYLLKLVREAAMPIVTTLHTVLREPSVAQKLVLDELLELSERIVVMSEMAVGFLAEAHGVPAEKVDLIPHGVPDIPQCVGTEFREQLGIEGPMILTFGLLSPDKGIQYVIAAMPKILRQYPGATYVVVGATHPHVRAAAGEAYRESLVALARDLGVSGSVRFVDRFVATEELVAYLAAMDVYVTPYLNPHQITSGTLAYSVAAGKAVISTPYWYAEELLAEGRGRLVPFRDAEAIADAILDVQSEPEAMLEMGRRAAEYGRQMLWPEVGKSYLSSFARAKRDSAVRLRALVGGVSPFVPPVDALPEPRLDHLFDLSDDTGILQHATYTVPNRSEGYCVDDNARSLLFTAYDESLGITGGNLALLQSRYLSFVLDAYNPETGRFRNFMSYGRAWLEDAGSEDSHGRSLWSLGAMIHRCHNRGRRGVAKMLFDKAAAGMFATTSPRTWAYGVLAADEYLLGSPHGVAVRVLEQTMASRLLHAYEAVQRDDWPWFEESLTYANARLPQALIVAGAALGSPAMLEVGLKSLSWLMGVQTGCGGAFSPIGTNGFYARGQSRALFDQQPVEAASGVSACLAAHRATGDKQWLREANRVFAWFLGENSLGEALYDPTTGGCYDGLHEKRVNRNQGAESTLSFLCALAELRLAGTRVEPATAKAGVHEINEV
ncbi:MAG: glycosyltransferase family 4 protein [Fimbriimonadaceae bacterium]|nr:glycosyltransferase family 4 protein [Fimbriimonadaceae bacterium]